MSKAIDILRAEKPILMEKFGVEEIAVFGSAARGDDDAASDIDILVKRKVQTLENYFSLLDYLEQKFRKKVDLVTDHIGLSERFRRMIGKDIVYV